MPPSWPRAPQTSPGGCTPEACGGQALGSPPRGAWTPSPAPAHTQVSESRNTQGRTAASSTPGPSSVLNRAWIPVGVGFHPSKDNSSWLHASDPSRFSFSTGWREGACEWARTTPHRACVAQDCQGLSTALSGRGLTGIRDRSEVVGRLQGTVQAPPTQVLRSVHAAVQLNPKAHGAAPGSRLSRRREPTAFPPPLALLTPASPSPGAALQKGLPVGNAGKGEPRWPSWAVGAPRAQCGTAQVPDPRGAEGAASGEGGAASSALGHREHSSTPPSSPSQCPPPEELAFPAPWAAPGSCRPVLAPASVAGTLQEMPRGCPRGSPARVPPASLRLKKV